MVATIRPAPPWGPCSRALQQHPGVRSPAPLLSVARAVSVCEQVGPKHEALECGCGVEKPLATVASSVRPHVTTLQGRQPQPQPNLTPPRTWFCPRTQQRQGPWQRRAVVLCSAHAQSPEVEFAKFPSSKFQVPVTADLPSSMIIGLPIGVRR